MPLIPRTPLLLIGMAFILGGVFQNCAAPTHQYLGESLSPLSVRPGYNELYAKLFKGQCLSCHGAGSSPDFSSYTALKAGSVLNLTTPASSKLYARMQNGTMPPGGGVTPSELQAVLNWISDGALEGPVVPATVPDKPLSLLAASASSSSINLAWLDVADDENGYVVERAPSAAGPFTNVQSLPPDAAAFTDTGLSPLTTYYYRVFAYNDVGASEFSNVGNATTAASGAVAPTAPTGLTLTAVSGTQINLAWTDNATTETAYIVERAQAALGAPTVPGAYAPIATLGANSTSYMNTGLSPGVVYFFRVAATNAGTNSTYALTSKQTFGTYAFLKTNLIDTKCLGCHTTGNAAAGVNLSTYALVKSQTAATAATSAIWIAMDNGTMPTSGKLSVDYRDALKTWIESGAPNN